MSPPPAVPLFAPLEPAPTGEPNKLGANGSPYDGPPITLVSLVAPIPPYPPPPPPVLVLAPFLPFPSNVPLGFPLAVAFSADKLSILKFVRLVMLRFPNKNVDFKTRSSFVTLKINVLLE